MEETYSSPDTMQSVSVRKRLIVQLKGELIILDALAEGVIRLRATLNRNVSGKDWAIREEVACKGEADDLPSPVPAVLTAGRLEAQIDENGRVVFFDRNRKRALLQEVKPLRAWSREGRYFRSCGGDAYSCRAWFESFPDESFYGLGQHQNGKLNLKGCVIDLEQKNTEVSVPFLVSSRGYGFLWNCPAVGRVELAQNGTRWFADAARELDYVVFCADSYQKIMEAYFSVTGAPGPVPGWATGFWQSKLRYSSQEELLKVAREYHSRGIPLSVIVIDYFHWTAMGDWKFDPAQWPDPEGMADELSKMGITLAISVWPSVNPDSENYQELKTRGLLLESLSGPPFFYIFEDTGSKKKVPLTYYDATNPEAREYIWEKVKTNYYEIGARCFWLDACEPEIRPYHPANVRMQAGIGSEVANAYPLMHEMGFYEGMLRAGERRVLNLCRSAWAGSQRYGVLVWSGDVDSSFEALSMQIPAGLNMAMSGIPWWTTDIGGFFGGRIEDENFRELLVRWFQFGVFCPVTRLHGFRNSWDAKQGNDNEVWSFGNDVFDILACLLNLRESMRPWIETFAEHELPHGKPFMRPLFFDYPDEQGLASVQDQYLFLDGLLVAPVVELGARKRRVVFPAGVDWIDPTTVRRYAGGSVAEVDAPLSKIPVFVREGSELLHGIDWSALQGMDNM